MDLKSHNGVTTTARLPKTTSFSFRVEMSAFIEEENAMTLKNQMARTVLNASFLLVILISLFFNPVSVLAGGNSETALPSFGDFSQIVQDGQAGVLRGVYVSKVLALPVVQQPAGNPGFVSNYDGQMTQFGMAAQFGTIGLLAHNHLAGKSFSRLSIGQEVRLIFGDGKVESFVITEILQYQALQPTNPRGTFRNLATDETLTANQLFERVYTGDRHITFQTCIEAGGDLSWGRLFIVAVPKAEYLKFDRLDRQSLQ